ncbi:hypothetical protein ABW636_04220 [Aquimarina sp. 2201CG1-2-11]|uniref:hypothetical protein n=1 Tax=Aquimarina discodermiae TaxID=3231043 RepID=UPI0034623880
MYNFQANYEKILEVLNQIEATSNFLFQIRIPKLSDKELIAINLTSEYMNIDSEHQLFRILPAFLSSRIEPSFYNQRKRRLFPYIEQIRLKSSDAFNEFEEYL